MSSTTVILLSVFVGIMTIVSIIFIILYSTTDKITNNVKEHSKEPEHGVNKLWDVYEASSEKPHYNVGDLLGLPTYYIASYPQPDHKRNAIHARDHFPMSILWWYHALRETSLQDDDYHIFEPKSLIRATNAHKYRHPSAKRRAEISYNAEVVSNPSTLTVHVRSGDMGIVDPDYIDMIVHVCKGFDKIILLTGDHRPYGSNNVEKCKTSITQVIDRCRTYVQDIDVIKGDADIHLCAMSDASWLMVHKGGFSSAGSLLCTGTVIITKLFAARCSAWVEDMKSNNRTWVDESPTSPWRQYAPDRRSSTPMDVESYPVQVGVKCW